MAGTITRGKLLRADLANWDGKTSTATRLDATGGTITGLAIGNEVDVLQVYGAAISRTRGSIVNAVQQIGSSSTTLAFAPGTWSIDADLTIPSNFICHIPAGCVFSVDSGKTLTFSGPVYAEGSSFYSGLGTTVLSADSIVNGKAWIGRTAAESTASITPTLYAYQPFDLRRYGADLLGVGASDTALSNAIAVCGTTGGTIKAPAGAYLFSSQVSLAAKSSIIVQGEAGVTGGAQPATRFTYTGTASPWINMDSAVGVSFRNVQLTHNNAGFTGTYIRCNNDGSHGDPSQCGLYDCGMGSVVSNTLHLDLNKCINFTAQRCVFQYGNPSVRGQQASGYSNVIRFRDCEWLNCPVAPVQDGGQAWTFDGCTFENLTTGAPGAIFSSTSARTFNGLEISGCWFGDATSTVGSWIDIYGQAFSFHGNYISGNATGSTAITLRQFHGAEIVGNTLSTFLNGINFATATSAQIIVKGNVFNTVTNPFANGNNVSTGTFDWGANFGVSTPGTNHGSLGTNGYMAEPTGLVRQWGLASFSASGQTVTFPLAFPNNCYNVVCTLSGVGSTANTIYPATPSVTGFTAVVGGAFTNPTTFYWQAIGN